MNVIRNNMLETSPKVLDEERPDTGSPAAARSTAPQTTGVPQSPLGMLAAGLHFQNPLLLAGGTAAYGREISEVIDLERLGGLVTKAVSLAPRSGARPLRVGEFRGGMINAVGLANPGVEAVRSEELPWLAANVRSARVIVNVVGFEVEEFAEVVSLLEGAEGVDAYELNVSCPNVKAGGMEFGASPASLRAVVERARAATSKPLFVKLSPALEDVVSAAAVAVDAGANALTLVNTMPGLVIDAERRMPALGFGRGGVSGDALLPIGVLATWKVHSAQLGVPLVGLGGVSGASDALQYLLAGASLVGMGTAALRNPRAPERLVRDLERWCERQGVRALSELVGALEWPE